MIFEMVAHGQGLDQDFNVTVQRPKQDSLSVGSISESQNQRLEGLHNRAEVWVFEIVTRSLFTHPSTVSGRCRMANFPLRTWNHVSSVSTLPLLLACPRAITIVGLTWSVRTLLQTTSRELVRYYSCNLKQMQHCSAAFTNTRTVYDDGNQGAG